MPELHLQRRQGVPAWVWLLGALALALLAWAIFAAMNNDRRAETAPQERVAGERQALPALDAGVLPVIVILSDPTGHMDRTVSGTATVAEVVSDRGFWLEENGQRLFAVIDEPASEPKNINAGQRVRLTGRVLDANRAANMPGVQSLEQDARQILDRERAFILVDARSIQILDGEQAGVTGQSPAQEQPAVRPDQAGTMNLTDIAGNPTQHLGQRVAGTATVVEDVSDRGFWIEESGKRLFAVIDEPPKETIDINGGQTIRFSGTVSDARRAANMPGIQSLEQETRRILDEQPAFILVDAKDIEIMSRPSP